MPLLRLASLIFASLLLASLSAFVPAAGSPDISHSRQLLAEASPDKAGALGVARAPTWSRVQAEAAPGASLADLDRFAGQSIPEAGQ